jgi:hypothetical protein
MQIEDELTGVKLTPEQIETVQMASRFVPLRLRAEFIKGLGDRLRPIRDIKGTDINHHIAACLQRYVPGSGVYRGSGQRTGWAKYGR